MQADKRKILSSLITTLLIVSILTLSVPQLEATDLTVTLKDEEDNVVNSGHVGQKITISGTNPTPGGKVEIYWKNLDPSNKLNETYSEPAGYGYGYGEYSCIIVVPETTAGTYSIIVKDVESGEIVTKTFTVQPKIELSPTTALPGDTITVKGTGFGSEKEVTLTINIGGEWSPLTTSPSTVETDTKGSFTCTFKVPSDLSYGDYTIEAKDEAENSDTAMLTIGATITLSPTSGPSGTVVTITGRGFTGLTGAEVSITMGVKSCQVIDDIIVRSDGTFDGEFVVPTLSAGTYTVTAKVTKDGSSKDATADFEVTGTTAISVSPTSGAPGETITVEGVNFTAKANVGVTIDFGALEKVATTTTNSTGGFIVAVTVPQVPIGKYTITVTDDYGLTASKDFQVAITTLALSPASGPTGTKVLLVGGGLTGGASFNVTINGELIGEGKLDTSGNIPQNTYVYVPTLPVGTYTITVMDVNGVTATASFAVTKTTEIVLTPSSAPQLYEVTIELNYFTAAGDELSSTAVPELIIYNVTAEGDVYWTADLWDIVDPAEGFEERKVNATGSFKGTFTVPSSWALGNYYINATDANDLYAQISFKVVEPTVIIYTGAQEYMPGDTVAFFAKTTFEYPSNDPIKVNLYTPSNFRIELTIIATTQLGDYYTGTASMILPSDSELGTWIWNATKSGITVNGTFTVVEKPTAITISEEVSKLKEDVADLASLVEDLSSAVATQASDIDKISGAVSDLKDAVSDLSEALSSLKEDVSNLSTSVSNAQSAAEAASEAAESAQGATSAIQTAVYGAVILSLIAAVAAIMSIVILQRKIAG